MMKNIKDARNKLAHYKDLSIEEFNVVLKIVRDLE